MFLYKVPQGRNLSARESIVRSFSEIGCKPLDKDGNIKEPYRGDINKVINQNEQNQNKLRNRLTP